MKKILICLSLLMQMIPLQAHDAVPHDVQQFLDDEIRKLRTGTDRALACLKKKYAANAAAMQQLNEIEPDSEGLRAPARRN